MDISPQITTHTIVLIIDRRERAVAIQPVLTKAGYRVVLAQSLYDALKLVSQEMPHLVVTDALLSDGTAGILHDRLLPHPALRMTPILLCAVRKSKEELAITQGRNFAGVLMGPIEPAALVAKINEVIKLTARVSPYFLPAEKVGIQPELTVAIEATAVGRSGEQLVSRSGAEIDPGASMVCMPTAGQDQKPAVLRMATNLREGDEIFNLFPVNRIVGAGRKWVLALPEITIGGSTGSQEKKMHKVIFYDPNEQRFEGFKEILKGYHIDLQHAKSMQAAATVLMREPDQIKAIYLHELLSDAPGIEFKNIYGKLSPMQKCPLIIGTTSLNARSQGSTRYIKRPFGMGLFVEMLQACFESSAAIASVAGKNASTVLAGIPIRYQAAASLVGLDETGGILQIKFPLIRGTKIKIEHKILETLWEGNPTASVVASAAMPSQPKIFHARFDVVGAGSSKVKYWEKIHKQLDSLLATQRKKAVNQS